MLSLETFTCVSVFIVPCPPPVNITPQSYDASSVNLTWENNPCFKNYTNTSHIYLFYSEVPKELGNVVNRPWQVKAINKSSPWILITDLTPAVQYNGYLLQSTFDGNGPPSAVFVMETLVGRKLLIVSLVYLLLFCAIYNEASLCPKLRC